MPEEPSDEIHLMTAAQGSRRMSSPVRVLLSADCGGDIDGVWWPRTSVIARELPDLIQAVLPTLGEIADISINWTANSPTPVLSTMSPDIAAKIAGRTPHNRLMFLVGRSEITKLLVIPTMTSRALALMVMRQATRREVPEIDCGTREFEAAQRIVLSARAESAAWHAARNAVGR